MKIIKGLVVRWIMLKSQKSSDGFLVFVIHDNYLLQWFYTDIWCILHFKFNILDIFLKYSIRAVPTCSTCQCYCWRRIRICFILKSIYLANLRSKKAYSVVSKAQTISFLLYFSIYNGIKQFNILTPKTTSS